MCQGNPAIKETPISGENYGDQAIPGGLILNEMNNSALKHAYQNKEKRNTGINLNIAGDVVYLPFVDDGIGISENINLENPKLSGIRLICTLSN